MAEASAILQRGILALAAMDLACEAASSPDKNLALMAMYRSRSLRHQQTALPQFRSLLENPDHSHADGKTIFVFSIFLLFLAFASAHSAETKPTIDDILDLFALFRGPRMLWKIAQENADRVVIDGIFPNRMAETPNRDKTSEGRPYQSLRALPLDEAATQALDNLTESWKFSQLQPSDVRCMAWFPALVPDLFCAQIRQRQPHALAILSEYAGILRPFRGLWWVRSWDQVLDEAIQVVLREESIALPVCKKS
ncbi:Hypothetical predicted protein [Lecanosticta acicola]|uniref:Uncharacterized protein n=1 Tax=Lecanosticta acicola TaxID=111012 RepID=A0AAI9E7N9_9PEZI|nr:Hypothetical predicted protein [Lecanosticta acicola]